MYSAGAYRHYGLHEGLFSSEAGKLQLLQGCVTLQHSWLRNITSKHPAV